MKRSSLLQTIVSGLVAVSYAGLGALVLVVCFINKNYAALTLGIVLIVSAICRLIKFLANRNSFDVHTIDLTMGLISVSLGFIFIFAEELNMEMLCIFWGLFEIVNGTIEISADVKLAHRSFLSLISVLISVGEIVFGTLLIIHLESGIFAHLLFMGITSILTSGLLAVEFVKRIKSNKKPEEQLEQHE